MDFSIKPELYQSLRFKLLCVCFAAFVLWQAFAFRVRQENRRLRLRLEARYAERERIARDLHDTLLQGFPALFLKMQAGVARLPEDSVERQFLSKTLIQMGELIVESRNKVSLLRSVKSGNLVAFLSDFASEQAGDAGMMLDMSMGDGERDLSQEAFEEAFFIMKESIRNACRHSRGTLLTIRVDYRSDALWLIVKDNGNGIDPAILAAGSKVGRWGLIGLHERARQVSAKLSVTSRLGIGTVVTLRIPGRIAYAPPSKKRRYI
jgi:signal transduction histidine kinase